LGKLLGLRANLDRAFQLLDFFIQAITGGLGMFVALMNIFIHYFPYLVRWLPIITQTFILLFIFGLLKKIFFYIDQIYPISNALPPIRRMIALAFHFFFETVKIICYDIYKWIKQTVQDYFFIKSKIIADVKKPRTHAPRKVYPKQATEILIKVFNEETKYPNKDECEQLANHDTIKRADLSAEQIQIWFKNQRTKFNNHKTK
jgi:hypothetical protein